MAIVIKLRKGLDINLKGKAAIKKVKGATATEYALEPDAFPGLTPKVVVKEGEHVLAGDPLLVNKQCPDVKFASPVSGTVKAVIRGERRRVLRVVVEADKEQQARDFGKRDAGALDGQGVIDTLCEAGLFWLHQSVALCGFYHTGSEAEGHFRFRASRHALGG